MPSDSSSELVQRSRTGDTAAMRALMESHLPKLRAFVRLRMSPLLRARESGSDLVQSACIELLHKLDSFEYRGELPFRAWLYQGVLRTLRDKERAARAQKRDARLEVDISSAGDMDAIVACYSSALSPSRQLMSQERVRMLEAAFDELPDSYREVITLSRIAGLSRAEVAAQMGRTEAAVRNLLPRALATLAEALRCLDRDAGE